METAHSHSLTLDELQFWVKKFAETLNPGDRLLLKGPMGAGKTTFVFFLMHELGIDPDECVASPTFSLLNRYHTRHFTVFHADLYRLDHYDDLVDLDILPLMQDPAGLTLVEWGDKFSELSGFFNREIAFSYDEHDAEKRILTLKHWP